MYGKRNINIFVYQRPFLGLHFCELPLIKPQKGQMRHSVLLLLFKTKNRRSSQLLLYIMAQAEEFSLNIPCLAGRRADRPDHARRCLWRSVYDAGKMHGEGSVLLCRFFEDVLYFLFFL